MKETVQISISGIAFFFDEEAYQALNAYLNRLEEGYRDNPDGKEILADIEARIAEIILGKQEPDRIVSLELIQEIISRLGFPEGMEPLQRGPESDKRFRENFSRRLYRNPDGARLGGVCNGLATFLGIDPVWVRLATFAPLILLILTATLGWGLLSGVLAMVQAALFVLYLLLWFAVPTARTPRQRLEMRGERITVSSIEKSFQEEFATVTNDSPRTRKTATVWAEVVWVLGQMALFVIKAVALAFSLFLIVASIALMVGFFVLLTSWDHVPDLVETFGAFQGMSPGLFLALCVLVIFLPVLLLLYLLLKLVFQLPSCRAVLASVFGIWVVVVVFVCVMAVRNVETFGKGVSIRILDKQLVTPGEYDTLQPDTAVREQIAVPDSLNGDSLRTL